MFYEEKIIDGILMSRNTPGGDWVPSRASEAAAVNALFALTDDERKRAFAFFCTSCGSTDPRCQCWNDD